MAYFSKLMRSTYSDNAKDKKSLEVPQDKDPKTGNQAAQTPQAAESNGHTKTNIEPAKIPGTQNNETNRPPSAPKATSDNQQKVEPSKVATNSKPISSSPPSPDRRVADRIKPFVNKFLFGARITDNLDSLTSDLKELFNCKEVTIYSVDRKSK